MKTINIPSLKEGYEQYDFIKKSIDQIRNKRNECLSKTDYMMLNDIDDNQIRLFGLGFMLVGTALLLIVN